ncbi:hypothetical protein HDV62DRAFT_9649 [Trichoderma sp. SZMC 28011]
MSGPCSAWLTHTHASATINTLGLSLTTTYTLTHTPKSRNGGSHGGAVNESLPISLSIEQRDGCTAFNGSGSRESLRVGRNCTVPITRTLHIEARTVLSKYTVSNSGLPVCRHSEADVVSCPLRSPYCFPTNSSVTASACILSHGDSCTPRCRRYGQIHAQSILAQVPMKLKKWLPLGPVTRAEPMQGMIIQCQNVASLRIVSRSGSPDCHRRH